MAYVYVYAQNRNRKYLRCVTRGLAQLVVHNVRPAGHIRPATMWPAIMWPAVSNKKVIF